MAPTRFDKPGWDGQIDRLARVARENELDTLVLRDARTLSWITGARSNVAHDLHDTAFDVVLRWEGGYGKDGCRVEIVTDTIERPRLEESELTWLGGSGLKHSFTAVPWTRDRSSALPSGGSVGGEGAGPWRDLTAELAAERRVLTDLQRSAYRILCGDTARIVGAAARGIVPGMTEFEAAGILSQRLLREGIEPVALFVGSAERADRHRHPLPTSGIVSGHAMLVVCARRHGLVANATRIVFFGPVPGAVEDRYHRLLEVERAFLDASVPGASLGDVFAAGRDAYARSGFAADEWLNHHQGGLTGMAPREVVATAESAEVLRVGHALAWNPSAPGIKVEDTCVVGDDGPELMVTDPRWPSVEVGGRTRPELLEV